MGAPEPILPIIGGVSTQPRIHTGTTRHEVHFLQEFCRALFLRRLDGEDQIYHLGLTKPAEEFLVEGLHEAPKLCGKSSMTFIHSAD